MQISFTINASVTGFVYLMMFFGVGLFAARFYKFWRQEQSAVSKFFFLGFCGFAIFTLIHAIGGLFFANNTQMLRNLLSISSFFRGFSFICFAYLIVNIMNLNISPLISIGLVGILSLISSFLIIITPYVPANTPFLDQYHSINWGTQPYLADLLTYGLYMLIFIPITLVFVRQLKSDDSFVKNRAIGFAAFFAMGIVSLLFDYIVGKFFIAGSISKDISIGITGLLMITFYFASKKLIPQLDERLK